MTWDGTFLYEKPFKGDQGLPYRSALVATPDHNDDGYDYEKDLPVDDDADDDDDDDGVDDDDANGKDLPVDEEESRGSSSDDDKEVLDQDPAGERVDRGVNLAELKSSDYVKKKYFIIIHLFYL